MMAKEQIDNGFEVNLSTFLKKVYKEKWLLLMSIGLCMVIALLYILFSTPKYEVSTSILIDSSGNNRQLGRNNYAEGVSLIEIEKNLFNEIGIIKSYSLIRKTVEDLNFDVSYFSSSMFRTKEHYEHFPFKVVYDKTKPQLYGVPFTVTLLENDKYKITIEAKDFTVSTPINGRTREIDSKLNFSKVVAFGQSIQHEYFSFSLQKPEYKIGANEFADKDLSFTINNLDNVANGYASKIDVSNIDLQASIFKMISTGSLVNKEVAFLNRLTENYIKNKFDSRNSIASTKAAFLRKQLDVVSDSLLKTEIALELFKKSQGAVDLGATASNALTQTQNLQIDQAKQRLNIRLYNNLINYINNNRNADEFIIPAAAGINDPLINQSLIGLKDLYALRARKKFFVTENNEEMAMLNGQINEAIETLLGDLRSGIRNSRIALGSVSSQIDDYSGVISTLPSQQKQLLALQRQNALHESMFNYLSEELAKTGIAKSESTSDTVILDEARMLGNGPVEPRKELLLTLAIALGLLFPMAKIVFLSKDDVIENIGQIMSHTNIPIIASIPRLKTGVKIPYSDITHWKVKEAFRGLAANLKFASPQKECSVLGITSNMPEEGKTFCSVNLGIALAEAGKKAIIIDTDLRLPRIVSDNKKIDGKGLSNYLNGEVSSLQQIIHSHETLSKLKFIPTEVAEDNIHEILSGSRMETLITTLREKFDYIILDTPAVGLVSDFILFSDIIDINLFILRKDIGKKGFLQNFEKLMKKGKKKKSFIIFNDAVDRKDAYSYGQTYGSYRQPPLIKSSLSV